MKFIGYTILTLISMGILAAILGIAGFAWLINFYGNDIPDYNSLKTYEPDVVTRVYTGDGSLMAEFATEKRVFVPIDVIPPMVKQAFISAEDQNFYTHKGLDYIGIAKAIVQKMMHPNSQLRGASTITQQVAKNFLLTNERSYERKLKEAILAIRMERAMTKDRLLELYMNEIYLGVGTYGVAAAAQKYFGKSLDDLTIEEAAYLAALPKAPSNYHPIHQKQRAKERRNWVISRLYEDGAITREEADIAQAKDLKTLDLDTGSSAIRAPYFAEEIRRTLQKNFGNDGLYKQGLIVKSSINPTMQDMAEKALREGLVAYDLRHGYRGPVTNLQSLDDWKAGLAAVKPQEGMLSDWTLAVMLGGSKIGLPDGKEGTLSQEGLEWGGSKISKGSVIMVDWDADNKIYRLRQVPKVQGAFMVMDPHTGRVLAVQGGWAYQGSEFNRATQAKRQPGSSFKPFIYLTALESGLTPNALVMDSPATFSQGENMPLWRPQNYTRDFYGPTTLRVGVEKSRNLMTVRLADKVGMTSVAETAKDFGIYENMRTNLASSLGSDETTLIQMVAAYGMLVNGGKKLEPSFIDRIQDRYGHTIFKLDARQCTACGPKIKWEDAMPVPDVFDAREQVTTPQRAYQMVSILEGVVQRGTAVRLKDIGFPVAGKTGTTNESKDAWFIGFTPDLVFGAYVGFDHPKPLGDKETGSSVALPIIKQFLEEAKEKGLIEAMPFRVPSGISMIQVNARTGRRAYPGDPKVIWEAFLSGETAESQQTVYGGQTVVMQQSNVNYVDMYQQQGMDTEAQSQPQVQDPDAAYTGGYKNPNTTPSDPSQTYDVPPQDAQQPQQAPASDDSILQGTGGIY